MTANLIRSSKQNPCPVCSRYKDGDCSQYADGQTVMCKTYVDGTGHDESKWRYTGINELGFQGKFVLKTEREFTKKNRPKSQKDYLYPNRTGSNLVKVTRSDDGNGGKKFYQSNWNGRQWANGCPKEIRSNIPIYRFAEVREAIERNELVFVVEGEGVADRLWEIGIAATTTIGGSGSYSNYGNYGDDLKGTRLVLCPDRDTKGLEYIASFERDFTPQIEGYYLAGSEALWSKPSGGMDIGDDIADHRYTKEQILQKVISPDEYKRLTAKADTPKTEEGLNDRSVTAPTVPAAEEDAINVAQELKESLELKNGKAPKLFGGTLGNLLDIAAANFNIPPAILTFCLLPVLSSQIDSRTQLLINPGTNYRVPAIRWCGLVGETGTKKSPILTLVTKPLSRQQHELYEVHQAEKDDHKKKCQEWKNAKQTGSEEPEAPPPLRDLYFSDFTIESIAASLGNYPNCGSLVRVDELAQFFNSMDSYRGGKGADRQKWLSAWNGDEIKINRKTSDTIYVPQSSISILGGIQPQTIANLMSGDKSDQDGLWNRFSFIYLPHNKTEAFSETPGDLGDELDRVYRSLSQQAPETHGLSLEAKQVWKQWHDEIEDRTIAEGHWLVKGTLAKFEGIAARNTLILHRTLAAIRGIKPAQMVERDTLELAIEWTRFELNQTLSQYKLLSVDGTDPKISWINKFIERFKHCEWVAARDVRNWWTAKTKPAISEIRKFMAEVVRFGYAIDNGESIASSNYQIKIKISSFGSPSSPSKPEPIISQDLERGLPLSPSVVHGSLPIVQGSPSNAGSADGLPHGLPFSPLPESNNGEVASDYHLGLLNVDASNGKDLTDGLPGSPRPDHSDSEKHGLPMDCGWTTDGLEGSPRYNPDTETVRADDGLLGLPKLKNKIKVGAIANLEEEVIDCDDF